MFCYASRYQRFPGPKLEVLQQEENKISQKAKPVDKELYTRLNRFEDYSKKGSRVTVTHTQASKSEGPGTATIYTVSFITIQHFYGGRKKIGIQMEISYFVAPY